MQQSFSAASVSTLLLVFIMLLCVKAEIVRKTFNVMDYGAIGDGITDDTLAFLKSWNDTCKASGFPTMIIPEGKTFLLHLVTFVGPCNSNNVTVMLSGTILAPEGPKKWKFGDVSKWLAFGGINWLTVCGGGLIDGRGKGWWDVSCRYHPGKGCLSLMPTALRFQNYVHSHMDNIVILNSPQTHVLVLGCQDAKFTYLNIKSPETSPNTDGIHIQASDGVLSHAVNIGTGDDCISVGDYTKHVTIANVYCGHGHRISIGSVGGGGNELTVEGINVHQANFSGSTNGVRIKTWQVSKGNVRDVHFSQLTFNKVENPIIMNQHYGDLPSDNKTGVHSNVTYSGAIGTSKPQVAINLNCRNIVACTGITLDNIQLASAIPGVRLVSSCNNAHGFTKGIDLYTIFFVLSMATMSLGISPPLNVLDFGAVGDGKTNDSPAFLKAWEAVCGANTTASSRLLIPVKKTFLLQPVMFKGPCKSPNIHIGIRGYITAPRKMSDWTRLTMESWIVFSYVNGLTVDGVGLIDGQGADWWKKCRGCRRPVAFKFVFCNHLSLGGLRLINSPGAHVSMYGCHYATISNIKIASPENSPNTDGIDISHSTNVFVHDCNIGAGDDCVAITTSSSYINVTKVTCGPGHGISIGSLGIHGENSTVEEVHVQNCTFYSTINGAHIKTWQGGLGYARKISFQDIRLIGTNNPINIDQFYCPGAVCTNQTNAVKISEVSFRGFQGTSGTETAIKLSCSESVGCTDIVLDHINITSAVPNKPVTSYCLDAHGRSTDTFPPVSCLLP